MCHLAVVQFSKKKKNDNRKRVGRVCAVPALSSRENPTSLPLDLNGGVTHGELSSTMKTAAAAVQRGSDGNRCKLLDSGSAHLHEARPRRGDSRHFKLAAAASALGERRRASPRQRATQTSRLK